MKRRALWAAGLALLFVQSDGASAETYQEALRKLGEQLADTLNREPELRDKDGVWVAPMLDEVSKAPCQPLSRILASALNQALTARQLAAGLRFQVQADRDPRRTRWAVTGRWAREKSDTVVLRVEYGDQRSEGFRVLGTVPAEFDQATLSQEAQRCVLEFEMVDKSFVATSDLRARESIGPAAARIHDFGKGDKIWIAARVKGQDWVLVDLPPAKNQDFGNTDRRGFVFGISGLIDNSPERRSEDLEKQLGLTEEQWKGVQRALRALGHDPGSVDGKVGATTRAALRAFQQAQQFDATGYLTQDILGRLKAVTAKAEDDFWQRIVAKPEREVIEQFIDLFPESDRLSEAKAKLAALVAGKLTVGGSFRDCPECPEMVWIPQGSFTMGSPASEAGRDDDEGPQHQVTIGYALAVGKYEVTFAEWEACVTAGGCGGYRPDDKGWGRGNRPVINVSWDDAREYVRWLSSKTGKRYRLLSEAEWEYAARAGTTTAYAFGSTITTGQANYRGQQTVTVGSFPPNAWGLHDMHGNVWEWVEDCYTGSYAGAPGDGSAWTSGNCGTRVLRGGSWNGFPGFLRSAVRVGYGTGDRYNYFGLRVARTD